MQSPAGALQLYLTATNRTASPLSGFAVQFNKNSFGLAPGAPLTLPTIAPGSTAETALPVVPNQLNSNTPPVLPLVLQVRTESSFRVYLHVCTSIYIYGRGNRRSLHRNSNICQAMQTASMAHHQQSSAGKCSSVALPQLGSCIAEFNR